jgi:phosphate:Na+ symporter
MVISILGGLGLFLLGMAVMTDGLRALAGSALRTVLSRAASTPAKGAFWGTAVTLIVQSSSATTMTTIGLVSAGLLTFPQALGVVFGANLGTTGTGWLVALLGVQFSLNAAAMPMLFAGALLRLIGRGRWAGTGGAIAGFALLLVGLTVLQGGMSGLATRLHPADLPMVTGGAGSGVWSGAVGVLLLVLAGIVMTTVMQSSSVAVAATLSALHAGAIAPDQAAALVIGQNIGTAVSSAIAAIGATTPAKRTAVAYVLFKVVTAVIALAAFPLYAPLIVRWAAPPDPLDATILLAAFHTAYNVMGVAILLPLVGPFARLVERIVPQRGPVFTRFLDRSVLAVPAVAVEAARRTVACVLVALCESVAASVERAAKGAAGHAVDEASAREAAEALGQARLFLSGLSEPPASDTERARLADTLHALDHASRFAENTIEDRGSHAEERVMRGDVETARAAGLCAGALRVAASLTRGVAEPPPPQEPPPHAPPPPSPPEAVVVADLARRSAELANLRRAHRRATAIAGCGGVAVDDAIAQVDAVRRLDRLAYHAWLAAAHLVGGAGHAEAADQTPKV